MVVKRTHPKIWGSKECAAFFCFSAFSFCLEKAPPAGVSIYRMKLVVNNGLAGDSIFDQRFPRRFIAVHRLCVFVPG